MSTHDDGGPAFPRPMVQEADDPRCVNDVQRGDAGTPGMSLRDWFAGQALATLKLPTSWSDNPAYWEGVARTCFVAADSMLAVRAKGDG